MAPAAPMSPVPRSITVLGSGTVGAVVMPSVVTAKLKAACVLLMSTKNSWRVWGPEAMVDVVQGTEVLP